MCKFTGCKWHWGLSVHLEVNSFCRHGSPNNIYQPEVSCSLFADAFFSVGVLFASNDVRSQHRAFIHCIIKHAMVFVCLFLHLLVSVLSIPLMAQVLCYIFHHSPCSSLQNTSYIMGPIN